MRQEGNPTNSFHGYKGIAIFLEIALMKAGTELPLKSPAASEIEEKLGATQATSNFLLPSTFQCLENKIWRKERA